MLTFLTAVTEIEREQSQGKDNSDYDIPPAAFLRLARVGADGKQEVLHKDDSVLGDFKRAGSDDSFQSESVVEFFVLVPPVEEVVVEYVNEKLRHFDEQERYKQLVQTCHRVIALKYWARHEDERFFRYAFG